MKCLFTYDYGEANMNKIRQLGYELIIRSEEGITCDDEIKDSEVLVCYNPFDTLDIREMKKLKFIQLSSVGIDQVPRESIINNKIILCNNKGGYSIPMGEWIVMKILELYKNSMKLYRNQEKKVWKMDTSLMELYGSTIGFIGTGTIAVEAAKRLQGFGVRTFGMNTNGKAVEYFDNCYSRNQLKEMLSLCDVVVIAIPYTEKTHHLVDKEFIALMKKGVYLINIARGSILYEQEIIKALNDGTIKKAALDVFEEEPLPENNPLWDMDNVIITCHNSWISNRRNERRFDLIYEALKKYAEAKEPDNVVNMTKGY